MPEEHEAANSAFLRQRRNLIVGVLIILFLETTVSPPDEFQITGVTLRITHADYVIYWAWIFTAYWLIRFFQYLPPYPEIVATTKQEHSKSLKRLLLRVANRRRLEKGGKRDDENFTYFLRESDVYVPPQTGIGRLVIAFNSYSWKKRADGTSGSTSVQGGHPSVSVRPALAIYFKIVAALDLVIRTPLFTEYLLPILLFLGAAISSTHRIF